jgi:hypothetical protein
MSKMQQQEQVNLANLNQELRKLVDTYSNSANTNQQASFTKSLVDILGRHNLQLDNQFESHYDALVQQLQEKFSVILNPKNAKHAVSNTANLQNAAGNDSKAPLLDLRGISISVEPMPSNDNKDANKDRLENALTFTLKPKMRMQPSPEKPAPAPKPGYQLKFTPRPTPAGM